MKTGYNECVLQVEAYLKGGVSTFLLTSTSAKGLLASRRAQRFKHSNFKAWWYIVLTRRLQIRTSWGTSFNSCLSWPRETTYYRTRTLNMRMPRPTEMPFTDSKSIVQKWVRRTSIQVILLEHLLRHLALLSSGRVPDNTLSMTSNICKQYPEKWIMLRDVLCDGDKQRVAVVMTWWARIKLLYC